MILLIFEQEPIAWNPKNLCFNKEVNCNMNVIMYVAQRSEYSNTSDHSYELLITPNMTASAAGNSGARVGS